MRPGPARAGNTILLVALALASLSLALGASARSDGPDALAPSAVLLSVVSDPKSVASGELVTFAATLTNAGAQPATDAWVNATLDKRLRFENHTGAGTATADGSDLSVYIPAAPPGNTSFAVSARAGTILDDRGAIEVTFVAAFTEGGERHEVSGDARVAMRAPEVVADLEFTDATASPGQVISFSVTVTNRGSEPAAHVWLNQSLHPALTYLADNAPVPPWVDGAHQSWHFVDLESGSVRFAVTVQVDPRAAETTVVTNFVAVDFTDALGQGQVRDRSPSIWFRVELPPPADGTNALVWAPFAMSATIVGGTYLGLARRRLRIEEIFLIHKSGVLLVHMSKSLKADLDTDILTGMFTAIMSFVRDAFHYDEQQELQGLDLGQHCVLVRRGTITYLALVHTGKPTRWMSKTAARAVHEIEQLWGAMLLDWDGDTKDLVGVRDLLKGYFLSPTGPSRPGRWMRAFARVGQTFKPVRPL